MNDLILAARTYSENRHLRDNRLVQWTQAFLIFFLVTLTLVSASIQKYLTGNMEALLGSDMVIAQYRPLSAAELQELRGMAQIVSETRVLPISLTHNEQWERVQLKLVDGHYPVQGDVTISRTPGGTPFVGDGSPEPGNIWVDSRVAARLGILVGDKVRISETGLTVSAILQHEPDRLMEGHTVDMRALVNAASFPGGGLPAENMRFRYLLAAGAEQRPVITDWVKNTVPDAQFLDRHEGQHPLAGYWRRVENFLGLASILLFFMGTIAISLAGRRQLRQKKYRLALYLSMGVPAARGLGLALTEWVIAFVVSLLPALVLAYGAQYLLIEQLQDQFAGVTAGLHLAATVKTIALVFLLLLCIQVPSLIQLKNTSIVSLVREQPSQGGVWPLLGSLAAIMGLAVAYSDNWLLTGMTLTSMGSALLLMLVVTWLVLAVGDRLGRQKKGILPFAFFIMKQRLFSKGTQILGLGLCATLLLFTLMLMKDIGGAMHSQMRAHNGNLMISDAKAEQMTDIRAWSAETRSEIRHISSFTKALVVRVNGETLEEFSSQPSETLARLERPIRLSWAEIVPANNRVTDGVWWSEDDPNWQQLSVEDEVMMDLGLSFGDVLTFDVGGRHYDFTLVSTHVFQSGGSNITYWFQVPERALTHVTASVHHMGSMELPETAWPQLSELLQKHPTLSVVSLQELTERFDKTLAMVTKLVVGFSAMILLLSLIVIVASVSGFEADDRKRNALLCSMGLSTRDCLKLTFYEWLITGLIASVGAVAGTWLAGQLIYSSQFSLTYAPDYSWIAGTLGLTCLIVCAVGLYFCRDSLRASIRELMAE